MKVLYCKSCQKEVVIMAVSYSPGIDEELIEYEKRVEKDGKLLLFNPPPFGPFHCPACGELLEEK